MCTFKKQKQSNKTHTHTQAASKPASQPASQQASKQSKTNQSQAKPSLQASEQERILIPNIIEPNTLTHTHISRNHSQQVPGTKSPVRIGPHPYVASVPDVKGVEKACAPAPLIKEMLSRGTNLHVCICIPGAHSDCQ